MIVIRKRVTKAALVAAAAPYMGMARHISALLTSERTPEPVRRGIADTLDEIACVGGIDHLPRRIALALALGPERNGSNRTNTRPPSRGGSRRRRQSRLDRPSK